MKWDDSDEKELNAIAKAAHALPDTSHRNHILDDVGRIGELLNQRNIVQAKQEKTRLLRYMKQAKFM